MTEGMNTVYPHKFPALGKNLQSETTLFLSQSKIQKISVYRGPE